MQLLQGPKTVVVACIVFKSKRSGAIRVHPRCCKPSKAIILLYNIHLVTDIVNLYLAAPSVLLWENCAFCGDLVQDLWDTMCTLCGSLACSRLVEAM